MSWLRRLVRQHPLLIGGAAGVVLCGIIGAMIGAFLILGGFNTAASSPHAKIIAWAAHTTMQNSVAKRAPEMHKPAALSRETILAGATEYEEHCIECHGGPGVSRAHWVSAMLPTPPYLLDSAREWNRGELFYVIDNGVKMTAMPAWGEVLPRSEVEELVDFVELMPRLKAGQFAALRQAAQARMGREEAAPPEGGA